MPTMALKLLAVLNLVVIATADGWQHPDGKDNGLRSSLGEGDNCHIKTGEDGVCTRLSSCGVYYKGLQQKTISYNFIVRCSFIGTEQVICCPQGSTDSATVTPPRTPSPTKPQTGSERPSEAACKRYSGFNPAGLIPHIVGDSLPVDPGEFPHMGAMLFPLGGSAVFDNRCGSSLISEQYVLTAAHCVNDPLSWPTVIRFGVVWWNSTEDDFAPIDVEIETIILHPEYLPHLRYHDIALIRLRTEVESTVYVRPACLYSNTEDVDPETKLAVIGWGVTNIQNRRRSGILLKTNVTTVPLKDCNAEHIKWGTPRSYRPGLNEGHYCASDKGLKNDACQADSGGPLQLVEDKDSTIVGIVSFGLSCGSSVPSVYTRVAHYLDWIESVVWPS